MEIVPEIIQNSSGSYSRADSPNEVLKTIPYSQLNDSDFGNKTKMEIKNIVNTDFSDIDIKNRGKELLILKEDVGNGKYNIYVIRKNSKYNPDLVKSASNTIVDTTADIVGNSQKFDSNW